MRFVVLDSWRGICAVLVCLFHFAALSHFYHFEIIRHSFLFVDFFFVLSGYVITHAYLNRLNTRKDFVNFIILRIGRIWPLHVAMLVPFLLLEFTKLILVSGSGFGSDNLPFTGRFSIESLVTNFFLVQSLNIHDTLTWNRPSWSISTELFTYIIFALLLVTVRKHLNLVSVLLISICVATIAMFSTTFMDVTYDYGLFRCIYGFLLGYFTYKGYQHIQKRELQRYVSGSALEITVTLLALLFVYASGNSWWALGAPFVFAAVIIVFAFERGYVSKILQNRIFLSLGKWSFSIYMVHVLVLTVMRRVTAILDSRTQFDLFTTVQTETGPKDLMTFINPGITDIVGLIYIVVVIILASITYKLIEMPGQRLFKNFVRRSSQQADRKQTMKPAEAGIS